MQIDHDPNEPPPDRSKSPWLAAWLTVGLLWIGYLVTQSHDWTSVLLGLGTGCILAAWAIEKTGNRVPASWRGKPPGA